MGKIRHSIRFVHNHGILCFMAECYYRVIDNYYERHFNVSTAGHVLREDIGIFDPESREYATAHYSHVYNFLKQVPAAKEHSTLLDYGCGKGRVIVAAAALNYRRIIGVELSQLIDVARCNVAKARHRKTPNIELIRCNAIDYSVPSDVNIIYFYNPFTGSILERVMNNVHASYVSTPRAIHIIFFNNNTFDRCVGGQNWLSKVEQSAHYPNLSCGIYRTK